MTGFSNRRRHWPLQIASVSVMILVLVMMNLMFLGANVFDNSIAAWGRGLQMLVYLKGEVDGSTIAKLETMARASGEFADVTFVSAEDGTKRFLKTLGGDAGGLLEDPSWRSPIPATFEMRLSDKIAPHRRVTAMRAWSDRFRESGVVSDVFYGQGWIENFSRFIGGARIVFAGLWLLASVVGLLIVGNCIQLSFQQRRDEVELLELLGATPRFIRRPYLIEGLALGAVASVGSLLASWGLHSGLIGWLAQFGEPFFALADVAPLPPWALLVNIVSGVGFGALGAWYCVRRLNTGWSASS